MRKKRLLLNLILVIISINAFTQNFVITQPKVAFDGYQVSIKYDIVSKDPSDIFYVIVEIRRKDNAIVRANAFKGDIGDSINPGNEKTILWIPENDAIYLDEDVTVEVIGERHERSFNKGSMILLSTIVPGLGQTKINNGKPFWLICVPAYGALAGGLIVHNNYLDTYSAYQSEIDPIERSDLYAQSQKQKNLSGALCISAAALWIANIVWVAATPNNYRPLKLAKVSIIPAPYNSGRVTMLSLKVDF